MAQTNLLRRIHHQLIAHIHYRFYTALAAHSKLDPQAADVNVYCTETIVPRFTPNGGQQDVAGDYPALVEHKVLQQRILLAGEVDPVPLYAGAVICGLKRNIP